MIFTDFVKTHGLDYFFLQDTGRGIHAAPDNFYKRVEEYTSFKPRIQTFMACFRQIISDPLIRKVMPGPCATSLNILPAMTYPTREGVESCLEARVRWLCQHYNSYCTQGLPIYNSWVVMLPPASMHGIKLSVARSLSTRNSCACGKQFRVSSHVITRMCA